jgi:hypothetical protein
MTRTRQMPNMERLVAIVTLSAAIIGTVVAALI